MILVVLVQASSVNVPCNVFSGNAQWTVALSTVLCHSSSAAADIPELLIVWDTVSDRSVTSRHLSGKGNGYQ